MRSGEQAAGRRATLKKVAEQAADREKRLVATETKITNLEKKELSP